MTIQNTGVSAAVSRFLNDGEVGGDEMQCVIRVRLTSKEGLSVVRQEMKRTWARAVSLAPQRDPTSPCERHSGSTGAPFAYLCPRR